MIVDKVNLHHAPINLHGDIEKLEFDNFDEHIGKSKMWEKLHQITKNKNGIVWLVSFKEEVFVTDSVLNLHVFIETVHAMDVDESEVDIFIQEYRSFESGYEVALQMQEVKQLCYNK